MKDGIGADAVRKRLRRVEGQIRGIVKMVEDGKPCDEVLIQIGSAKAALAKTGQVIMEGHIRRYVPESGEEGDDAAHSLISALEQFSRIV